MRKIFFNIVFQLFSFHFWAQPGKDGTLTVSSSTQIVNQYSPISASISAGTNTLSLATTSIISLCPGDLIMVYQAQGAAMATTNSATYGTISNYNSAGFYEFKYVQSISGNILTTQSTFTNAYALGGYPQVVKVPQFSTLTINPLCSIVPKPWKDTTIALTPYRFGGLVVIHAATIVNNGTITASGYGFRGGQQNANTLFPIGISTYVSTSMGDGGEKGESISGSTADYDINGGRYCRGAAANGGGGGTSINSSGGGGANGFNGNTWNGQGVMLVNANNLVSAWMLDPGYIANSNAVTNSSGGGRGGYSWGFASLNPTITAPGNIAWGGDSRREVGGMGGRPLTNINPETRIYFGGGGGAGHANNSASGISGSNGGGIVYIIATNSVTGSGLVMSNGLNAQNSTSCPNGCDGVGGAGAGGSVVVKTSAILSTQVVSVTGGIGSSQITPPNANETEGAGGGGGGGVVAISAAGVSPIISGGLNGSTVATFFNTMNSNGATQGALGQTLTVSNSFITYTPASFTVSSNSPVCVGSVINFTSSAASTYSWTGPNGYLSANPTPSIANASTLMAGIYSVSATNTGACPSSFSQTIAVTVNPSPTLGLSNSVVCPGGSLNLVATGAASYTWNPGALIGNSLTINPLATTIYTVIGTSIQGCTASANKNVFVPSTMTLNIASSASSVCVGSNITLTASTSGGTPGYSYTWTTGPFTPVYNVTNSAGVYVYTVTSRDFNNCFAVKTTSVTFVALPTINAPGITICSGNAATLTASGAASYTWLPGNFTVNPFTLTPLSPSGYTVVGSASGCSASATSFIGFNPVPSLSFNTSSITCATLGSATVAASGGALGPYSYSWSPSAQSSSIASNLYPGIYTVSVFDAGSGCTSASTTTFTSLIPYTGTLSATNNVSCFANTTGTAGITVTGGSNSQSYLWSSSTGIQTASVAIGLGAGLHTVVVTDALTFCTVTQNFLITQPLLLSASALGSATLACVGSNISLTAFASGGTAPYTYNWTSGPLNSLYNTTQTVGGTYIYTTTITDQNNCQATANATLTFVPFPTVTVNSATICIGAIASLTASGAQTYTWNPGGFTGSNINVAATSSQAYIVTGNDRGCLGNGNAFIVVNPTPILAINSSSSVCEGSPINLNATGTGNFVWLGPNGFSSISQNTIIPSTILGNAGVYSLTLTDNNGCSASTSTFITVLRNPQISAIGASVCIGESSTLFASGGNGYVWIGPNNYIANSSSAFVPVVNNNTSGSYTVLVTGLNGCSSNAVVQLVAYNFPLPSPSITANTKICLNSKINLKGSGGGEYFWQGPENFNSTDQNLNFDATSVNLSGIYTLTVRNASNCSASSTVQLMVYPPPQATLSADRDKTCIPLCVNFSFLKGKNIAPIVKTNLVIKNLYSSDSVFNFCIPIAGVHLAQALFADTNGCVNTSTLILTTLPQPIANFEYSPENPAESVDEVVFRNTSLGENINKWEWFFNENGGPIGKSKDASLVFEKAGTYPVAMIATNSWGCADTIVKSILVEDNFSLFVPNAFSPNADGKNDIFMPKGVGILSYHLEVFDRWGEKIFVSDDLFNGWDGAFKGNLCKNEVFIWKIDLTGERGKTKNLSGHVTLNR